MKRTKPVHEVRIGAVKAAIWENTIGETIRMNVTFSRLYKDGEEWKTSESFGRDDLLLLAKVADQAHSWIFEHPPAKPELTPPNRAEEGESRSPSRTEFRRSSAPAPSR